MKRACLLVAACTMLVFAAAVSAHAPLTGSACTRSTAQRSISLHVHGMTCKAAYAALVHGSTKFTCKTEGNASKLPVTEKCTSKKNKSTYYMWLANGG
jgi:hypothetical protein